MELPVGRGLALQPGGLRSRPERRPDRRPAHHRVPELQFCAGRYSPTRAGAALRRASGGAGAQSRAGWARAGPHRVPTVRDLGRRHGVHELVGRHLPAAAGRGGGAAATGAQRHWGAKPRRPDRDHPVRRCSGRADAVILPAVADQLHVPGGRRAAQRDLPDAVAAILPAVRDVPGDPARLPDRRDAPGRSRLSLAGGLAGADVRCLRRDRGDGGARRVGLGPGRRARRGVCRGRYLWRAGRAGAGRARAALVRPAQRDRPAAHDLPGGRAAVRAPGGPLGDRGGRRRSRNPRRWRRLGARDHLQPGDRVRAAAGRNGRRADLRAGLRLPSRQFRGADQHRF